MELFLRLNVGDGFPTQSKNHLWYPCRYIRFTTNNGNNRKGELSYAYVARQNTKRTIAKCWETEDKQQHAEMLNPGKKEEECIFTHILLLC